VGTEWQAGTGRAIGETAVGLPQIAPHVAAEHATKGVAGFAVTAAGDARNVASGLVYDSSRTMPRNRLLGLPVTSRFLP